MDRLRVMLSPDEALSFPLAAVADMTAVAAEKPAAGKRWAIFHPKAQTPDGELALAVRYLMGAGCRPDSLRAVTGPYRARFATIISGDS